MYILCACSYTYSFLFCTLHPFHMRVLFICFEYPLVIDHTFKVCLRVRLTCLPFSLCLSLSLSLSLSVSLSLSLATLSLCFCLSLCLHTYAFHITMHASYPLPMSIFYLYSGIVYCILIVRHVMSVFWQHDTHGHPPIYVNTISHMHQNHGPRAQRPQVRVGPKKSCIAMPCLPATNPVLPVIHSAHDVCHVTHSVHPVCRHMHWANSV